MRIERLREARLIGFNWEFAEADERVSARETAGKSHAKAPPAAAPDPGGSAKPPPGGLPRLWLHEPADPGDPLAGDVTAVRRILDLPSDREEYVLDGFPFGRRRDHVGIRCRSLLGIMFFLSQAIEVPPEDVAAGRLAVTRERDDQPFDWRRITDRILTIHSQKSEPSNAFVAVKDRDWWFYVADDDPDSKATFALLGILYSLQQMTGHGKAPVLTLPVGD